MYCKIRCKCQNNDIFMLFISNYKISILNFTTIYSVDNTVFQFS